MKTINTTKAPAPIGPYCQAKIHNDTIYMSGQIAINPDSGELIINNIQDETVQVMENIKAVLTEAKSSFEKVIKCSIFLSDMNNFAAVNEIYGSYFETNFPARECVQVSALPKNVNVEITVIASV